MKRLLLFFSSIPFRLLLLNALLVFLPVASFLYLDTYERQLLQSLEHALVQQARILSAALSGPGELNPERAEAILRRLALRHEARLRVIGSDGALLADSSVLFRDGETVADRSDPKAPDAGMPATVRESALYRAASFPFRLFRMLTRAGVPKMSGEAADGRGGEGTEFYGGRSRLLGEEVRAALEGRYGSVTRISSGGQISVTLYSAVPVRNGERVVGAVLVSQSTYRILRDLYDLRVDALKVFLLSLGAALLISLFLSITIARPLRVLRNRARELLDSRGRIRRHFPVSRRRDEIGDLANSLRELTCRLEERIRFVEAFAADVSHEFRNPLASIRSAADVLHGIEDERERSRFLSLIEGDVGRMERLIAGVREISRIDAFLGEEEHVSVDLSALTDRAAEGARLRTGGRGIVFRSIGDEAVMVRTNPDRISRILENLLDNAAGFSPAGGTVTTAVRVDGGFARLSVSDEGPGIVPEHLDRVFERFFSYRPKEKNGKHSGLGLAIVKAIVEGYGGTVLAENLRGRGSRITVRLPLDRG